MKFATNQFENKTKQNKKKKKNKKNNKKQKNFKLLFEVPTTDFL